MKTKLLLILLSPLIPFAMIGQISFTDNTPQLIQNSGTSGVAMAVVDMNGDGLDDIVRLQNARELFIEYQKPNGAMFETLEFGDITTGGQWSMCIADIDRNGTNEILSGGAYNGMTLTNSGVDGNTDNIGMLDQSGSIFLQGSNFVDINNDGHIDIFGCHDDGASFIWANDGNGNYSRNTDWIDLSINGQLGESASGNYGSIWSDIDSDGDIDLYIAKCRQGVTNPADHRRINKLYINDGNGNYTEEAEARGLAVGWQSWTADMQDINNDGYYDVFITNHDAESQMFLNDGTGHFTELSNTGIDVDGLPIQGIMRDFDNDGWVDLLVAGSDEQLFINNRDNTFTEISGAFNLGDMQSFALGDLNNDGYVDVYGGYATGFNNPGNMPDKVWLNDGGENNYVAINLKGEVSNINAIGARIEIYGDWGMQCREVRSGESYGIMNSTTQYFGIGQSLAIDSLIVRWPSGIEQTEYDLAINSKINLLEGGCLAEAPAIMVEGNTTFCSGDSLVLTVPSGYDTYEWSTGDDSERLVVYEGGTYSILLTDADGCLAFSENIEVTIDPQLNPEIVLIGEDVLCEGESTILSLNPLDNEYPIIWTDGTEDTDVEITEAGIYSAVVTGLCGDFESNAIEINVFDYPAAPIAQGDMIKVGETATITAEGDNIAWYLNDEDDNHIATGNEYSIDGLTETTTFYAAERQGEAGLDENVGMESHSGTLFSGVANSNNLLIFDAVIPFRLDSVKVYTDVPGLRKVLLLDSDLNELNSAFIDVPLGESMVYIGMEIPEGLELSLTCDEATNVENIGTAGPRLQRSSESVEYPYVIDDVVSIWNSNFGSQYYYYFYDWKISTDNSKCIGDKTAVDVIVDDPNNTIDIASDHLKLFPNPTTGPLTYNLSEEISLPAVISIFSIDGKMLNKINVGDTKGEINLQGLPNGVYQIRIANDDVTTVQKIVVAK